MKSLTKNFLFFSLIILVISITGFATSLSVSLPQRLGSGSADVEAPPGVSVTSVRWTFVTNDPSKVDRMVVTVSTTDANLGGAIYFVVKDMAGNPLQTFSRTLSSGAGTFAYDLNLSPDLPASDIGSVAVTVIPP
jgi:hypothetical protein